MHPATPSLFVVFVVAAGCGAAAGLEPRGELLTATYFRSNMPAEWRAEYEVKLAEAQKAGAELSRNIKPVVWKRS